jgi:alpha-L-glutamate ligase-like protein
MWWLFGGNRLRRRGVLGINRRNAECILQLNPQSRIPIVDDKLLMAELCARIGVPTPAIFGVIETHSELRLLPDMLAGRSDFVVKTARGAGGRGILIVSDRVDDRFRMANGRWIDLHDLRTHISESLTGMFSLGVLPDRVLLQQRVRPHPYFEPIAPRGVADIRIVLYRYEPAMAMLRLPTLASDGRANLHQGGIGVGVDLATGRSHHAVLGNKSIDRHPDTGESIAGWTIPWWGTILDMARKSARAVGLGFVGIDIVIDENEGPLLLEANARPGLAIQLANNRGLGLHGTTALPVESRYV